MKISAGNFEPSDFIWINDNSPVDKSLTFNGLTSELMATELCVGFDSSVGLWLNDMNCNNKALFACEFRCEKADILDRVISSITEEIRCL